MLFIIPDSNIQLAFAKIVQSQLQMMAVNEQENQQLTDLRDWILPMLMNGQVQVVVQSSTIELPAPAIPIAAEPDIALQLVQYHPAHST